MQRRNLALAVHNGDAGALERLVETYQDRLFGFALHLLRDHFDAQEVTQDAFLRAHRALTSRYDAAKCGDLPLKPWLFCIVRNLAHNRKRSRRSLLQQSSPLPNGVPDQATSTDTGPELEMQLREKHTSLERALGRLSRSDRELVLLRFMEGMAYGDIAAVVGGTESSVRGRVFRALRKLRSLLAGREGYDALY